MLVTGAAPSGAACRSETFEGDRFTICTYDPARDALRLIRRGGDGRPAGLQDLPRALGPDAPRVRFAMNAGMYDVDRRPLGLFVADGREQRPILLRSGSGNFFLKPNGVFWIDGDGHPHVTESAAYAERRPRARWATQSGPLLLNDGAIHPRITPDGPSRHIRNGVGVCADKALFAISDAEVSFGRFARLFRDGLGCSDALYLDGSVSSLWASELGRMDRRSDLGTFVVVLGR